jgi:hypothetical protein
MNIINLNIFEDLNIKSFIIQSNFKDEKFINDNIKNGKNSCKCLP